MTAAAVLLTAAVAVPVPGAAAQASGPSETLHLLDVPYLPQSEALCGGAAVAMVMRYWGTSGVYAETFASLVDRDTGGIRGADLLRDLRSRGWEATSFRGDPALVRQQLAARRPVIALIEDRPSRYHYVVIVGWQAGRVILHDPARAPFRIADEAEFVRAWEPTGFWTLVVSKPATPERGPAGPELPRPSSDLDAPCQGMVDEGVRLADAAGIDAARRLFETAAASCPGSPAPWREMAGLHALGREWREAAADARAALARDPRDEQAWRILAAALYVEGDARGALAAWNAVGEPRVDLVNVKGLERTRYAIASAAIGVAPGALLTPASLARAERRLRELPAAQAARVAYRPGEGGRALLDAVVIERPLAPASLLALAAAGVRAATDREIALTLASPSGGGEAIQASWRWWSNRPRVAVGFQAPAPFGGVWGVDAAFDRQAYSGVGLVLEESRRTALFRVSDWTAAALRWQVSLGLDGWHGQGRAATAGVSVDQRLYGDRLALRGEAVAWTLPGGAWTAALRTEWESAPGREGQTWLAKGGISMAGANAPLALWPGAGTGQGRDLLLRAHPLLDDGIVRGVFGRRMLDAGVEWRAWRSTARGLLRFAPALFVDAARAEEGTGVSNERWQLDAGGGLRVAVPGSGVIRLDVARGLRDGGFVFSAGWTR